MRILITGTSGFIGRHVVPALAGEHEVVAAVRRAGTAPPGAHEVVVGDIDGATDWDAALVGVEAVVHLAARVHVMRETGADSIEAYREVNTRGTARLAQACVEAGVRRFVFLSSIKVNAESTAGASLSASDDPRPVDPYGISKLEAEDALRGLSEVHGLEVVIIRPPVVYGVGVGGNVRRIVAAVRSGFPLPFGAIRNRRTMIAVENLALAVNAAVLTSDVPRRVILVGDSQPVSTVDLVRYIAQGMGVKPRLVFVPVGLLRFVATMLGRRSDAMRLTEDLVVDANWSDLGVPDGALTPARIALAELGSRSGKARP